MRFIKLLTLLAIFCCVAVHGMAQENSYDTSATVIQAPVAEDEEIISEENTQEAPVEDSYVVDTTLTPNGIFLSSDSIQALKSTDKFAYARNLDSMLKANQVRPKEEAPKKFQPRQKSWLESFFASTITQYFFWFLAAAFVLLILYKLFFTEGFFQRRYASMPVKQLADEMDAESIQPGDYSKLIAQAAAAGQYRLATRYHFLQSLHHLSSAGLIQQAADKTNDAYLHDLDGHPQQHTFAALSRQYEYIWYGQFDISETIFLQLQERFHSFNRQAT